MKIVFETPTLFDPKMLLFLGVSVKESKSPIGFFGTGLKYAIACILRMKGTIEILIGKDQRLTFKESKQTFRKVEKDVIICHGIEQHKVTLPFTLDYGQKWKPWQVYRELWSNTYDENGYVYNVNDDFQIEPKADTTFIIVHCNQLEDVHLSKSFLFKKTDLETHEGIQINTDGKQIGAYYKSIHVAQGLGGTGKPLKYAYNFMDSVDLSEDRMAADTYSLRARVGSMICQGCDDEALIEKMISRDEVQDHDESTFDFNWCTPSEEFLKVCRKITDKDEDGLVFSAKKCFQDYCGTAIESLIPPTDLQKKMMEKALAFLKKCGVDVTYPIVISKSLANNLLGKADREGDRIILSKRAFDQGTKSLASTIYEEHIHILYGLDDCTRAMQQYLFDQLISSWEEHVWKEPI
jgi:hypothetical protein